MRKRGQKAGIKSIAFSEIFVLIIAIVAFAFIMGQINLVGADDKEAKAADAEKARKLAEAKAAEEKARGANPPPVSMLPTLMSPSVAKAYTVKEGVTANIPTLGLTDVPVKGFSVDKAGAGTLKYIDKTGATQTTTLTTEETTAFLSAQKDKLTEVIAPEKYTSALGAKMGIPAGWASHLVDGVVWGAGAFTAVYGIASMLGAKPKQAVAMGAAAGAGVFVGQMVSIANIPWWGAALTGAGAAAIIFLLMYKKEKEKTVTFTCLPWEAPVGGKNCEKCNNNPFMPCTEYRCRSLGQACELENKDTPGKEMCVWRNPKDVTSPTITTWREALKPEGLSYVPDKSIRPPALGVKIERSGADKCLQAFTSLEFGIITNEPSQCKIDLNHTTKFDNMEFYFGESNLYNYNHTQRMKLPGPDVFDASGQSTSPIIKNDGSTALFVRCRDANGNENVDEYMISFCVDKSPDTTAPLITGTSLISGSPVQFGADKVPIEVYTNEPAECKWSKTSGIAFEDMNSMNCASDASEINAQLTYTCSENLTGVKDREDNTFYFKCKDKPGKPENERYVMTQSYPLVLKGSQPLNIVNVGPNGTISGSTETVAVDLTVETSNGAEEGKAVCAFSPDNVAENFVSMFETNSYKHKQTLDLVTGNYAYFFRCIDLGGNIDESSTTFAVFVDKMPPSVTRVYRDETMGLKVVTNEDADCAYSLTTCNFKFEEGLKLEHSNPLMKKVSGTDWKAGQTYYIKCRDAYGNEPNPNECSVTVKAV
jgi:hypothetical protein